ncbi:MAG: glycosyltransferase family 4 protein [Planctomycetota bacterium]|nr:glycosyltransferase family 4 protein [Planctomycetota bacterium]
MRIAMANNYYYIRGGAERVLFEEKRILEANGHQVPVFSQTHPGNEHSEYSDCFPPFTDWRAGSVLRKVPTALGIMYNRRAGRGFLRFLRESESDVVHAHNIYGGLTTSILDEAQRKRVPVVMTLHDYKLICPSYLTLNRGRICEDCKGGKFIHCLFNRCHKESLVASSVYCLESYLNRWLHKYDSIRYLICPSLFSLRKHAENGISEERLVHIPNFVNAAEHEPNCEGGEYALFVGRLSTEKGIMTLLRAIKELKTPLRIVGDGPLRTEYELFVRSNRMSQVTFEGYRSGDELESLYQNARFVVMPSECHENAPMTILEAYSYGKPVIGSRIGGIPEMIEQGRTGLLFESGNVDELVECIHALLTNKSLNSEMGRSARDKVKRKFSSEVHYRQLMEIYTEICSAR